MKRGLLFGSLVLSLSLVASVWTYRQSLNRAEPLIAVAQPASVTTNPFNLTGFTKEAKIKVYSLGYPIKVKFVANSQTYEVSVSEGGSAETTFSVKTGDIIGVTVNHANGTLLYGWALPTDPATRYCKGVTDPVVAAAQAAGETVVSVECWNDDNAGDDPYDDFELVMTQLGAALASPSPSPSASPSPSPSASPEASPSPGSSPSPSPSPSAPLGVIDPSPKPAIIPSQPDTGTPTGLTMGLLALITVITIIKIFL